MSSTRKDLTTPDFLTHFEGVEDPRQGRKLTGRWTKFCFRFCVRWYQVPMAPGRTLKTNPPQQPPVACFYAALEHFRKNLNHPTLPEVRDFNALGDPTCIRYFEKCCNGPILRRP